MGEPLPLSFVPESFSTTHVRHARACPFGEPADPQKGPDCSPVGDGVPWYVGLSDYGSLRLRRRRRTGRAASLSHGKQSADYGLIGPAKCRLMGDRRKKAPGDSSRGFLVLVALALLYTGRAKTGDYALGGT